MVISSLIGRFFYNKCSKLRLRIIIKPNRKNLNENWSYFDLIKTFKIDLRINS